MSRVIFGVASRSTRLDSGMFFCPNCDARREYALLEVQRYFNFLFVPIFERGDAQQVIECRYCQSPFGLDVLNYRPPSEAQGMLEQFHAQFIAGSSYEAVRQQMISRGLDADEADRLLEQMCGGRPRSCSCGQHYHPGVPRCGQCGAEF